MDNLLTSYEDYVKSRVLEAEQELAQALDEADTGGPQADKRLAIATGRMVLAISWCLNKPE